MADSILNDLKAALGLAEDHTAFDTELVMFTNSVLSRLTQLGAGPAAGFRITGSTETWTSFMGPGTKLDMIKGYMFMRLKLYFDPPEIGFVLTMMKEQIEKDEYLINLEVEPDPVLTTTVTIPNAFGEPTEVPIQVTLTQSPTIVDGTVFDGGDA
jgi:hypothetical protein